MEYCGGREWNEYFNGGNEEKKVGWNILRKEWDDDVGRMMKRSGILVEENKGRRINKKRNGGSSLSGEYFNGMKGEVVSGGRKGGLLHVDLSLMKETNKEVKKKKSKRA